MFPILFQHALLNIFFIELITCNTLSNVTSTPDKIIENNEFITLCYNIPLGLTQVARWRTEGHRRQRAGQPGDLVLPGLQDPLHARLCLGLQRHCQGHAVPPKVQEQGHNSTKKFGLWLEKVFSKETIINFLYFRKRFESVSDPQFDKICISLISETWGMQQNQSGI